MATQTAISIRGQYLGNIGHSISSFLGVILVVILMKNQYDHHLMEPTEFFGFLYLFLRFVQTVGGATGHMGTFSNFYIHLKKSVQFFFSLERPQLILALSNMDRVRFAGGNWNELASGGAAGSRQIDREAASGAFLPEIRIEKISFGHEGGKLLFRDLGFSVAPGNMTAIMGQSGAGKSTLLSLVMGLLDPTSGRILIDGMSPADFFTANPHSIGYVGPEPFLIEGSIRENLLFGNPYLVSDSSMIEVLEQAQLGRWLKGLGSPLDYHLNENGDGLSTGQKQRLSLARALLLKPRILILDEISANLDVRTEDEIAETLSNLEGSATVLIVTHRERLIRNVKHRIEL
jgi:ABC-type multidrug transport system fused ATPase/permease subunit